MLDVQNQPSKSKSVPIAQTERLILRPFILSDAAALEGIFCDPEVMRFGDGVQTREWIEAWVKGRLQDYQERGFGPYAVVEKATGEIIGYGGLFYFPDIDGRPEVEIGYRLIRRTWGKGFATEAATAARDYAFNILHLRRLISLIDPSNAASIRVAQNIGMTYEKDYFPPEYDHPDHVYALAQPISD